MGQDMTKKGITSPKPNIPPQLFHANKAGSLAIANAVTIYLRAFSACRYAWIQL